MAIRTKAGMFKCVYCEREYKTDGEANQCRDSHDLVYIPIARAELNKLINYLMIPDGKILDGTSVVKVLFRYSAKGNRSGD
jgi:hypothetical protein